MFLVLASNCFADGRVSPDSALLLPRPCEIERQQAGERVLGRNVLRPAIRGGDGAVERIMGVGEPAPESPNTAIVGACLIARTPSFSIGRRRGSAS